MIKNAGPSLSNQLSNNLNFKQHQRHHSYSNPQFIHSPNNPAGRQHHKRSFSHNSNNLEVLKRGSSINLFSESKDSLNSLTSKVIQSSLSSLDFKGEAINFRATTDSLLESLNAALEIMQQKEELYAKKLDQDLERKKKFEEMRQQLNCLTANSQANGQNVFNGGPDYFEEGPNSKIKEEEFFDALDAAMLDKNDQQEEEKRQLKLRMKEIPAPSAEPVEKCDHPLWPEINKVTLDQLYYARLEVGADLPNGDAEDSGSGWQLFAEEGEMRLYKREVEIDGLVCDPLKAVHVVKRITGEQLLFDLVFIKYVWCI